MSLPSYTVWFRGLPACPCLAEWLPWFERVLIARGVIRESIDIAQLIGSARASANTHKDGGAFDVWQHDPVTQEVGREMGAATFNRVTGSFATNKHSHGVLNDCPHNGPARYQIEALAAGYDGLGAGGRSGLDTGPGPRDLRTWREGIAWATEQLEDDMADPKTQAQLDRIEKGIKALRKKTAERHQTLIRTVRQGLDGIATEVKDDATKGQVARVRKAVDELAEAFTDDGDEG